MLLTVILSFFTGICEKSKVSLSIHLGEIRLCLLQLNTHMKKLRFVLVLAATPEWCWEVQCWVVGSSVRNDVTSCACHGTVAKVI